MEGRKEREEGEVGERDVLLVGCCQHANSKLTADTTGRSEVNWSDASVAAEGSASDLLFSLSLAASKSLGILAHSAEVLRAYMFVFLFLRSRCTSSLPGGPDSALPNGEPNGDSADDARWSRLHALWPPPTGHSTHHPVSPPNIRQSPSTSGQRGLGNTQAGGGRPGGRWRVPQRRCV
eukprot:3379419-Rhodomonas_salina.1